MHFSTFISDFLFLTYKNKIHLSLLVLRLRNKKLQLLMQQRRPEGSNAQKKELRWFWIPILSGRSTALSI